MNGFIAKRYAKALFDVVIDPKAREQALEALAQFQAALEVKDPDTGLSVGALSSARHMTGSVRVGVVTALAKHMNLVPQVSSFVRILAERGRLAGLPLVIRHFRDLCDKASERVRVVLRTATPLGPEQEARVRSALSQATGQQVILDTRHDPELIGGLVVHFNSLTVDRSVRRSLDEIRQSFSVSAAGAGST